MAVSVDAPRSAYPAIVQARFDLPRPAQPTTPPPRLEGRRDSTRWFWCPVCCLWRAVPRCGNYARLTCSEPCRGELWRLRWVEKRPTCIAPGCLNPRRAARQTCSHRCAARERKRRAEALRKATKVWHERECLICGTTIRRRFKSDLPMTCKRACTARWVKYERLGEEAEALLKRIDKLPPRRAFEEGYRLCMRMVKQHGRRQRWRETHGDRIHGSRQAAVAGLDGRDVARPGAASRAREADRVAAGDRLGGAHGDDDAAAGRAGDCVVGVSV